jgi:hypothetical protein
LFKPRKLTLGFGLFYQWFSMIAIVSNMNRKSIKLIQFVTFFQNQSMFSIGFGAGAVGAGAVGARAVGAEAGAASHCGSGFLNT